MSSNLGKSHVVIRLHAAIALEALQEALIWGCIHELCQEQEDKQATIYSFNS